LSEGKLQRYYDAQSSKEEDRRDDIFLFGSFEDAAVSLIEVEELEILLDLGYSLLSQQGIDGSLSIIWDFDFFVLFYELVLDW
jgi:hypothetical protein